MLVGFGIPLRIRTPWFASKYGAENPTTFAREEVIVTSSIAKSYFFGAGENSPPNGARTYTTLLIPSCLATAWESAYSKPDGFLIVVPVTRPFQNPGAGTSKPTVSVPAFIVGAADWAAKAAAVVTATPTTTASARYFLTASLLGSFRKLRQCTPRPGTGIESARSARS